MQHARTEAGELEHLIIRDNVKLACVLYNPGVCGVNAVNVREDLALVCLKGCSESNRCCIGSAATECSNVVCLVNALEACYDNDLPCFKLSSDPVCIDTCKTCVRVRLCRVHCNLESVQRNRCHTLGCHGHSHKRNRDLLSDAHEHVKLSLGRVGVDVFCLRNQLVRRLAHSREHYYHVMTLFVVGDAPVGHSVDSFFVSYGGASEFLNYQHFLLFSFHGTARSS